jgi:hypothetical protein
MHMWWHSAIHHSVAVHSVLRAFHLCTRVLDLIYPTLLAATYILLYTVTNVYEKNLPVYYTAQ